MSDFKAKFKLTPVFNNTVQDYIYLDKNLIDSEGKDSFIIRQEFKNECEYFILENLENGNTQKYNRVRANGQLCYLRENLNRQYIF